tara:strand:- start:5838 stop:6665 length:828 start_codon:yes stop_codon:yes gene_type:complete
MQQRMVDAEGTYVFGTKPVWTDEEVHIEDTRIHRAINWYSYKYDKSIIKNILIEYFLETEETDEYTQQIKTYDENKIRSSVAWICDMILSGLVLVDPKSVFLDKIDDLKNNPKKFTKEVEAPKVEKTETKKVSPMLRVRRVFTKIVSEIDQEIDDFMINGYNTDFNVKKYSKTIKPIYGKMISQHYQSLLTELQSVVDREDTDLVESYSYMKRSELRRFVKLIKEVVDIFGQVKNKRTKRKTTKRKRVAKEKTKPRKPKKQADIQLKTVPITDFM